MLAPEMKGAATRRNAGSDPKFERLGGVLNQEIITGAADFQLLGDIAGDLAERLRIARLRRQFGLNVAKAALIADLAFTTTGRRY
ncbi:hypothetical protein AMST5_02812 [freshwater sediment metagenome]|uniref:Uncharacterized protein n=1 Tax=freshwater sediment metagenome TaxID=556182 RepID=A0AA48M4E6_9ZZZZ